MQLKELVCFYPQWLKPHFFPHTLCVVCTNRYYRCHGYVGPPHSGPTGPQFLGTVNMIYMIAVI